MPNKARTEHVRKLTLNRETLRTLAASLLAAVQGGRGTTSVACESVSVTYSGDSPECNGELFL
jgi:hypothetical protein